MSPPTPVLRKTNNRNVQSSTRKNISFASNTNFVERSSRKKLKKKNQNQNVQSSPKKSKSDTMEIDDDDDDEDVQTPTKTSKRSGKKLKSKSKKEDKYGAEAAWQTFQEMYHQYTYNTPKEFKYGDIVIHS